VSSNGSEIGHHVSASMKNALGLGEDALSVEQSEDLFAVSGRLSFC
jgi:hypothetical protein